MKRQNLYWKRHRNIWISGSIGALCLVLLAVCFLPIFGETLAANDTVQQYYKLLNIAANTNFTKTASDSDESNIWFYKDDLTDTKITFKKRVYANQSVSGKAYIDDEGVDICNISKDNSNHTLSFNDAVYSKDAVFYLSNMDTHVDNMGTLSEAVETDYKCNESNGNRISTIWWESSSTFTLYKIVKDESASNSNSFSDFESGFRAHINNTTVSGSSLKYFLREPDQTHNPKVLLEDLESYIDVYNRKHNSVTYESGDKISLDGVTRIDMITCSWGRFDFLDGYSTDFRDYELMVYQTHSYVFPGCTPKLVNPEVTLESGKSVDSLISTDDVITFYNKTDTSAGKFGEDYKIQYLFSDILLADFTSVSWIDYNSDKIFLEDEFAKNYLYTQVVQIGNKSLINSTVCTYHLSYVNKRATDVAVSPISNTSVDKGDRLSLSATDSSGIILYYLSGADKSPSEDISWDKVDGSAISGTEASKDNISYWFNENHEILYVKVNGIYYQSSKPLYLYDASKLISVGNEIYKGNLYLYAVHLQDGRIIGNNLSYSFPLGLRKTTVTPSVKVTTANASVVVGDEITMEDTISLSSEENSKIFYTLDGTKPTVYASGNKVIPSGTTTEYIDELVVKNLNKKYGASINLRAIAVSYEEIDNTKTKVKKDSPELNKTYNIVLPKLENISIKMEGITNFTNSDTISRDGSFQLELDVAGFNSKFKGKLVSDLTSDDYTIKYTLSTNVLDSTNINNITNWNDYTIGESIALKSTSKYLYVKAVPKKEGVYKAIESDVVSYNWNYYTESAPSVTAIVDDNSELNKVAAGSSIRLKFSNTPKDHAMILYALGGTSIKMEKVNVDAIPSSGLTDANVGSLSYKSKTADGKTEVSYVKVNGIWYACKTLEGEPVYFYDESKPISIGKEVYGNTSLNVLVQPIVAGCVISVSSCISFKHELTTTVTTPEIFTSNGTETIKMGESVSISCKDTGTTIFYTLDGSAPSIMVVDNQLKAGNNTYLYDGSIVMSENQVDYGQRVTITAQAVSYETVNGTLVRNKKDSELIQRTYLIENQSTIEAVTSIPATNSEKPTVVMAGSKIHLSCKSENTTIFYTLDGTEPSFDKTKLEVIGTSTYKYSASQGVTVPEAKNSTLLTITAVAYDGVASSDITRLIYQYPEAVSSPYVTPAEGAVTENTEVILKTASADAIIYYEIAYEDATPSTPNAETSIVFDATSPIKITKKTTIKAIAVRNNMKSVVSTFVYTVADKLKTPESSIESGSIISNGTMIRLKADEGATIHYTIDGSDPKDSKNKAVLIGDQVLIQGDVGSVVTLKAYASKTNFSDSEIAYYTFSISSYSGGIYADKEDGSTVKNGEVIHLNTDVSDADIYYTTDGSTPTNDSSKGSSVKISGSPNENVVVKAIAVSKGTEKSISFATFTYKIMNRLAAPTASVPDGAVFTKEGLVTLTAESGKIYYTTDGSEPSTASNLYRSGIRIQESLQIKAIAVEDGYEHSEVSSFSYAFASQVETPQASFASGELEMGTEISFYCATEGASLYYRTDGIEPDPSNKNNVSLYTGPITVDKATTFKVIAVKDRMQDSKVVTVAYTVREPIIEELIEEEESQVISNNTDRLQSRRSFSDIETGPSYSDVVLKNATYGAVVSADEGILPDDVQLKVEYVQTNNVAQHSIKQMISENYGIVASYDVSLLVNGEATQPNGKVEIGIPIPVQYENSLIQVVHVDEDGTIEVYDTRRSRGVAYAKVDHFSVYALAAPIDYAEKAEDFPWKTVIYFTSVAFIGLGGFLLNRARKMKKEGEE